MQQKIDIKDFLYQYNIIHNNIKGVMYNRIKNKENIKILALSYQ